MRGLACISDHVTGVLKFAQKKSLAWIANLFVIGLVTGAIVSALWINDSAVLGNFTFGMGSRGGVETLEFTENCPKENETWAWPGSDRRAQTGNVSACPEYFRWIHEDLRPWKATGISNEMVERGRRTATFRLVILEGRAYLESFSKAFQTRDVFTLWGVLQLLRRYPGRVPDLELMFDCGDLPVVRARDYAGAGQAPPPLFTYSGDGDTLDLVFPDWSFWGWPEVNIMPWEPLLKDLKRSNERLKWMDRIPYAFWKGNSHVSKNRRDLLKCNLSPNQDWNARLYEQNWDKEAKEGFQSSNICNQCIHRYKIYIEGIAWSISKKYILACDSLALFVNNDYYDFFTRGLMPMQHYCPIRNDKKCRSIKYAVDWGNNHIEEAQLIGMEGSNFIQEQVKMDYVYDYMFHLINEYSKLLSYKPLKPKAAIELTIESMICSTNGRVKEFMVQSMEKVPAISGPCTLPLAFNHTSLEALKMRRTNLTKQAEIWENQYSRL